MVVAETVFGRCCVVALLLSASFVAVWQVGLCAVELGSSVIEWNATMSMDFPGELTGLKRLRMTATAVDPGLLPNGTSVFFGVKMKPPTKGYAPVAAGTMMVVQGNAWKAFVSHRSCSAYNNEECTMLWSHLMSVNVTDTVILSAAPSQDNLSLVYTTEVYHESTQQGENMTENVFLINNYRVRGLTMGIYIPDEVDCDTVTDLSLGVFIDDLVTSWDEVLCNNCSWTFEPDDYKPSFRRNRCLSIITPSVDFVGGTRSLIVAFSATFNDFQ